MEKKIYIASDHAGYEMKSKLCDYFKTFIDLGTNSNESVDYADFAHNLTNNVSQNEDSLGILICGTGVGMSMAANRKKITRLIRQHNNANVLVLPGRFMADEDAKNCVQIFLETEFEAGRHIKRIEKI